MNGAGEVFLAGLSQDEQDALRAPGLVRSYPRGTALFHERQAADRVLVVLEGCVKLSCLSEGGKEVVLAIRGPGDLLGELAAIDGQPRSATATALEPVQALSLSAGEFRAFLETHPRACMALLEVLSARLRDADHKRVEFAAEDSMTSSRRAHRRAVGAVRRRGRNRGSDRLADLPGGAGGLDRMLARLGRERAPGDARARLDRDDSGGGSWCATSTRCAGARARPEQKNRHSRTEKTRWTRWSSRRSALRAKGRRDMTQ